MHLHIYKRGPLLRYGVAIIAVAIALVARYLLIPYIGVGTGYITLLPAILIVAKLAGRNPAIVTGLIGGPAAAILFTPTLALHTVIELAIVIGTAVLTGWLVQGFHNARDAQTQILESIPGMVFTTRPDGYCDYQSLQWVNYTGVPSEQMLGDGWNKLLHPEDQPRALAAWRAAIEGRAPYDLDYRIRRHDGKYEWFKVRGHPIRNAEGRIAKWFGVAINIDAFKRAQENLLHAKELLESRNTDLMQAQETLEKQKQGLEAIIHVVSHDLRAPLLNVRGFSDILKDECTHVQRLLASEHISDNTSKQLDQIFAKSLPEAFGIIETSARAMHNLIDSLVKIARAGLVVPVPETVDMTALLREIVDSISIKFKETGVTIDLLNLPACYADRTHVAQIFTNLIDNAIKYRDPTRPGCICVDGAVSCDHVLYWVSDNGLGIGLEHEQKVFDILYRINGKSGTGECIGLSVVKRMVERNNGRIWLVSEKGKGSSFFIALPLPPTSRAQEPFLDTAPTPPPRPT